MLSRGKLKRLKKRELKVLCEESNLSSDGVKDELIDRLCDLKGATEDDEDVRITSFCNENYC